MSSDEDVVFATIAAVSQAKMGLYSPLLEDASENSAAIGADTRTLAKMLVKEEKKVLCDLRQQLMSVVSRYVHVRCAGETPLEVSAFILAWVLLLFSFEIMVYSNSDEITL